MEDLNYVPHQLGTDGKFTAASPEAYGEEGDIWFFIRLHFKAGSNN